MHYVKLASLEVPPPPLSARRSPLQGFPPCARTAPPGNHDRGLLSIFNSINSDSTKINASAQPPPPRMGILSESRRRTAWRSLLDGKVGTLLELLSKLVNSAISERILDPDGTYHLLSLIRFLMKVQFRFEANFNGEFFKICESFKNI